MKRINIIAPIFVCILAVLCVLTSCDDWTDTETIDKKVERPQDQNPELWAQYTAALMGYKQSEHFITYALLHNSPETATSEKDFMRGLPDSLDIVSLTNADNFSAHDEKDLLLMKEKNTKVLYQVDYAARSEEFNTTGLLSTYLDRVISAVKDLHLDGFSFTGIPNAGDDSRAAAAALIVEKLSAAKADGQLLVFEGNPLFVAPADRSKVDYFVLDTENTDNVTELKMQVRAATGYADVPAEKLLLAAYIGAALLDEEQTEHVAITEMTKRVVSLGPLAGLGIYNIGEDYYDAEMNYKLTRNAIQTLNPSK